MPWPVLDRLSSLLGSNRAESRPRLALARVAMVGGVSAGARVLDLAGGEEREVAEMLGCELVAEEADGLFDAVLAAPAQPALGDVLASCRERLKPGGCLVLTAAVRVDGEAGGSGSAFPPAHEGEAPRAMDVAARLAEAGYALLHVEVVPVDGPEAPAFFAARLG